MAEIWTSLTVEELAKIKTHLVDGKGDILAAAARLIESIRRNRNADGLEPEMNITRGAFLEVTRTVPYAIKRLLAERERLAKQVEELEAKLAAAIGQDGAQTRRIFDEETKAATAPEPPKQMPAQHHHPPATAAAKPHFLVTPDGDFINIAAIQTIECVAWESMNKIHRESSMDEDWLQFVAYLWDGRTVHIVGFQALSENDVPINAREIGRALHAAGATLRIVRTEGYREIADDGVSVAGNEARADQPRD